MNLNRQYEEFEKTYLSKYAAKSSQAKRDYAIEECAIRSNFQRDRDRIIHSKAFRRLIFKTQVFINPKGDHYRTRLTHTLEVNQIARTIARALRLNEDLVEAIALGHDLGHTPFGHTGEQALNELLPEGFEHNIHSLKIVEKLENNGKGLNLTDMVRDGILHHKRSGTPLTLEGKIVSYSDRIAYLNHDIDDAIRAGVIKENELPKECIDILGENKDTRINNMILDIIKNSYDKNYVSMSNIFENTMNDLRNFMFSNVYEDKTAKGEEFQAMHVVKELYGYYIENPQKMPEEFFNRTNKESKQECVKDYIAGMTDRYAIDCYNEIFVPKGWRY